MPTNKNCQKLTLCLTSEVEDFFGVIEVCVLLNGKEYTYPINSKFALEKFKKLLGKNQPGKALDVLKKFKLSGFNSFDKGEELCHQ
jgi:hypothetical protein